MHWSDTAAVYHPRNPKSSQLWRLLRKHYVNFALSYEEKFVKEFGFLRSVVTDVVMAIQTFGDYAKWHPHIHALVADGLFRANGTFHVMPRLDLRPLAELYRANVLAMLKKEGKIDDAVIAMLFKWRHNSGFSVHNGVRIRREDEKGREALAQYIIRR